MPSRTTNKTAVGVHGEAGSRRDDTKVVHGGAAAGGGRRPRRGRTQAAAHQAKLDAAEDATEAAAAARRGTRRTNLGNAVDNAIRAYVERNGKNSMRRAILAGMIGMSGRDLNRWLKGEWTPTIAVNAKLRRIEAVLGCAKLA